MDTLSTQEEFKRQVDNLLQKNYPQKLKLSPEDFLKQLDPFEQQLKDITPISIDIENGKLPFVIVVKSDLISVEEMMTEVDFHDQPGMVNLFPCQVTDFKPIDNVTLPITMVYLLVDIDRGKNTLNVTPAKALESIEQEGRTPLTIDEGVALITHYPEFLIKNNCFSLLASRLDKRVPAIWISQNKPKLGWCWENNPHTWLGSASAKQRIS